MEQIEVKMEPRGIAMDIDKKAFALALKTYRLRQGLTQKELGAKWGCSRWTIMRAESGKDVTWETAYKMFARLSTELQKENEDNRLGVGHHS